MGTFGSAALHLQDDGDGDDDDSDEENKRKRLPPLLEDEENVSLADILCLRDDGLTEQELWAVCVECVCSLQSISLSPLYHRLCITPDTLAFNAHGNVCFMEQMNDDPDACFIPPEFHKTGNTFEGHVFSLGSSLSSALNYISDVELELSPESTRLLKQMQMENPEDRPPLQDVMSQAEVVLGNVSPASVCRSLSAIGRRVLSIESVAALQDGWETSGQQFVEYKSSRSNSVENLSADGVMIRNFSSDSCDGEELPVRRRALISNGSPWSGGSSDSRSQNSSPVHRRSQGRSSGRARRALNRSCSVPDSNNPPAFSPPPHAPISMMMADLSDITEEENAATGWSDRLHRVELKKTSDSEREESETADHTPEAPDTQQTRQRDAVDEETREDAERRAGSNHMSRSVTCLNVEFQNQWMSLRDVLSQSSRPFSVNELWALCHMCLTTLQTYSDLPDDLCLDSVYVTREGEMLFMRPKNTASCDVFFMAPEFQTHGIVTEKACVYGVAAILWTTAKFHLSPNQKLAMPRKLKRLLLEMARKTPVERPSIETVKKCCRDYLARQGTDAEMVWTELIHRLQQALVGCRDQTSSPECAENTSDPHLGEDQTGFVSLLSEGRMAPVTGPVPHHNIPLPEAFTSPATHFSPIVLTPNTLETDHQSERSVLTELLTDSVTSDSRIENILAEQCEEGDVVDGDFSSSSSKTLQNSPASPQASDVQLDLSTLTCVCGICTNFLLQQDPLTGHLTLLPVHIAVLQPITGQESLSGGRLIKKSEEDMKNKSDINRECSVSPERRNVKVHPETQSVSSQRHSCTQQITHLIRHQFIFDGHLEDGSEDLTVAEYICSLKNLQYERFCGAVNEKFRDVFWDPELLCVLYRLIHHLGSDLQSSSEAVDRAVVSLQCNSSEGCVQRSPRPSSPPSAPEEILQEIKTQLKIKPCGVVHESEPDESVFAIRREDTQEVMSQAPLYESKEVSVQGSSALKEMQFSTDPEGGAATCVPETEPLWHRSELEEGGGAGLTPNCLQAHMDDSDSVISDRTLSGSMDPRDPVHDPAWALALYGEDSFSPDVLNYAQKLCSHCESPSLEDKSQELQQQLLIESRNLKKTRNFHHKLIHQERSNKGSDTKLMMSKVKLQFDELRDKVHFLLSVKKYLQVLWVDQWGLSLSLLPSLSVCGSSVLQSSDDPAVLSSVCEQRRGKHWPLVTASAAGLMVYLYARKAHIEGFIRQFLYTFRYFCTPEELLEFLMDKYNNTLGATEDQTSDCVKVHQRTVDLLHMWVEDALSVDFSSCLLQTLESFLTSKVAPVHSRGERLLSMLQATPRKRRVCGLWGAGDASIRRSEYEDLNSLCRKSHMEDASRQIFHRRVSRVLEPQTDQTFSIAAALPRPCYVSFMRSDETPTFSQTEHAALHTAQQLTLLEQEIFQDCHPVHFLKSRAHGVMEKSANISRCVSVNADPLQILLTYTDWVSNWVSAELVICDSVKAQTALLTRFLAVGKFCYEMRNFATAVQILSGLENVIVRQLPAWKCLPLKVCALLEELKAVQVFLKSDNLCLMEGRQARAPPTLPAPHILAMHLQQLEIGSFTTTSGSLKWTKLRNIARVVSQVHAFQENLYSYTPDLELQSYLRGRIARLGECDISLLASDNNVNFNQMASDRHGRRIQDTLRRVKASFQ